MKRPSALPAPRAPAPRAPAPNAAPAEEIYAEVRKDKKSSSTAPTPCSEMPADQDSELLPPPQVRLRLTTNTSLLMLNP